MVLVTIGDTLCQSLSSSRLIVFLLLLLVVADWQFRLLVFLIHSPEFLLAFPANSWFMISFWCPCLVYFLGPVVLLLLSAYSYIEILSS